MPDPKVKKSKFDNLDYSKIAGNIVDKIPIYEPKDYSGKLDLRSSTLESGVPAAVLGDQNSENYLAELKAQRQGWLDKFANGTLQAANTAVVGTIGNTAGVVHGLVDLADNKSFFDNSTFKFMDEWDEAVKEAIPLYRSQKEQNGGVADRVFDKDFLFGDVFQGLGFVGSSIIPGVGWTKAGKLARTAMLANKINKLDTLITIGAITSQEAKNLANFIKTTDNIIKGATNLGAATMGRMYESRLEAKDVYDSTFNKSYDKKLQELTGIIADEEAVKIAEEYATKQATDARNFTFGANMLLAVPDFYQYSKIFGNVSNKVNTVNRIASNTATDILQNTPKSLLGKTSKTIGNLLTNDKVLIAGTEALEEGTQYNIAEASKKLAEKDYDFNVSNYVNEFINQSIQNISSPEFLTASLAGAVVGGGLSFLGNNKNTDNPNAKSALQSTNENADLLKNAEIARDNTTKFVQLEQDKTKLSEKISNKNTPEEEKIKAEVTYRQINNLQFAQSVKQNLETGNLDNFLLDIETLGTNTKEQTSNDFGVAISEYEEDGKEIIPKEKADKSIKRAKKQASIYQDIQTKYNNLSQISKDELYNNMVTSEYNNEKLNVVTNKITKLILDKASSEQLNIPFTAEKQSNLDNLNKEKEILINSQKDLDNRFTEIRTGKTENRQLKTKGLPEQKSITEPSKSTETPIETIKSNPESKFKGSEIEILSKNNYPSGNKITFKVKGSTAKITLSEPEYNKQVLGTIPTKAEKQVQNNNSLVKKDEGSLFETLPFDSNNDYDIKDLDNILTKANKPITEILPKDRKDLGTSTFFNSPLFFGNNTITKNRNEILSQPDWKSRFRIKLSKEYVSNSKEEKVYKNGKVNIFKNAGQNALDIIIQYNDIQENKDNWLNYGSLPYTGMLRDNKDKPYDFSLMSYNEFIEKFFITKITDSTGVEQTIEFTPEQFELLKIQQNIFNEFETLVKQFYNNNKESEIILPSNMIDYRISYFINTGEVLLSDLSNVQGFSNSKLLTISDGKINKELTSTNKRLSVPEDLIETYGTSNKTFINVELDNGTSFWTIAYVKGNNKKLESEISNKLSIIATNFNTIEVNPENDLTVNNIIREINSNVFINNNLENYLNFRAYPLESKKGYKIKVQLKTDNGSKYIDIFNPEITIKENGERLSKEELQSYFSFDNLSNLINDGFKEYSININPNSFISNNVKGNPKIEDLAIPITSIDFNIKFNYNIKELPTLKSSETLDKSTSTTIDDEIEKEVQEKKTKLEEKKKTNFSKVLTTEVLPLKGNEETYKRYNLLNKEGQIKSVDPNSESVKEWIKTNNNSPYYLFVIRQVPGGKYKIFIKDKVLYSKQTSINDKIDNKYLDNISSKLKEQYNLDVIIEPVFDALNNPVKGQFKDNTIYLNPNLVTQDTPIHEVIHPFVELIQQENPVLYKNLILELKKSDIGKRIINTVSNNYGNSTQEEILDESLVTLMGYYASGVIPNEEKDLLNIIKALFKKIAFYIKNIFNKDLDPSTIATSTTIAELSDIINNNKIDLGGVVINNTKESKLDLLTANDSNKLINTVGAKTVERITEKPTKQNLNPIIDSIIEQTKIENNTRNIDASNIEDLEERKAYKLKRHLVYEALSISDNVEAIKKSVIEDILKMHYSEENTYSEEDDIVQNVNDEADIKDYEEGVENSGGWNNVDPAIRNFIYYNTYTYIDEAGIEVTEAVDGLNVYKSIQSALADKSSEDFLPILEGLAKYDIQLKSILNNFKIKAGIDTKGEKTLEQSNFYNKFFKTFENAKLEYTQVFENKKGEFVVSSANKSTSTGRLFNRWKNNFITNKDSLKVNADKLQKIINDIGSEVISDSTNIVNSLYIGLNNLGIGVSKPYLEYSFISESPFKVFENEGVVKLDIDTINRLLSSIKKDNDIFEQGTKGSTNLLNKIAEADSIFRSDSIEDTYRDSRGKLRNSYTKQNLITKTLSTWKKNIQNSEFIKSIKEDKLNYYHYNYLFNNKLFTTESELQEVFKNADLSLIGDIRLTEDKKEQKYTTRNITSSAFSKMQLALYRNSTSPKDIIDNSNFKFDSRTNTRQKFAFVDFGKISDKNTEVALRLPIDDRFYNKGFTDWFIDQVYNTVFLQEYNKLKNYDTKSRLYYSKDKSLSLNPNVIKNNKLGNGWLNLSIFNNNVIDEFINSRDKGKNDYSQLKDLLKVEDLSTKKELIKSYIKESFSNSFNDYKNILLSEETIKSDSDFYDLGNMYANNFILRTSFQQLIKGDLAVSKDLDDDLKRNSRVTAYGDSGIDFTKEKSSTYKVLYMTEALRYKVLEDGSFRPATQEEIETGKAIEINSDDAGVRMTVKHLIDTLQRLGRLDTKSLQALNKIDQGETLSKSELALVDLIPLKGVHGGVDRYFKMSQFTLIKEFTSIKDKDGNWIARKGREQLHNLRTLMESNNVGMAIPKSASKSISKELFNQNSLFDSFEYDITNNSEDVTWDDWRLQVENESGKTEISQPVQILQMIDGSSKVSQEIKDELQELYKLQREDDFNDALNIATGNTSFGKQALIDKFYDNGINSAADSNTLEYLSGENGEFNYNANLPHITFTRENYITSHFNKSVLAQKVPGYKCTLAPATGIQVVRNIQTGEIVRSDVYETNKKEFNTKEYQISDLRIHSKISPYTECLMTKSQAEKLGLTIGDNITEAVFKMVGTRLPCQGYSSMIPIKIVDFLPECYGSTIIAPEEIVYIAGSDYDVDSLFIMRKEAYKDKEGNTRYYTYNEVNNDLRWQDYKQYLITGNKNIINKLKEGLSIEETLKAFNYPSTKEEFLEKEKKEDNLLNSKYSITNRLVDIYEDILTNPDMLEELHQPVTNSGFDIVAKTIYLDLHKQGSKVNYFHNSDKALKKHFELATQGKRDVGPAAIGNSISSFYKKHKVTLKEKYYFSFNGKSITNVYEDNVIDFDFVYDNNGKVVLDNGVPVTTEIKEVSKQEVHSGLMSISVDNQKDPVCFMLNLDPSNMSIASTMVHLGIGGKGFIATFMNSDPVKTKSSSKSYQTSGSVNNVTKESLVKSMMGIATSEENCSIALLYERLQNINATTFNMSVLLATNKGIGSTFEDLDKIIRANNNIKDDSINVFSNLNKAIEDNKNLNFNLSSINTIDNEVLSKEFLSRSKFMNNLREFLDKTIYPDINLDKDFSGFLISNILKHNRNIDFNDINNLAIPNHPNSIVSKYFNLSKQYPEFKNNTLIKFLTVERGNMFKPDLLYFNQSIKLNGKSLEKLTNGYRELLQSELDEVSNFAKDMFYYLIVKDNMKFTVNSFGRLLAPEVFKQISSELKIAIEGINEKDDIKLKSIVGKDFNQLSTEFIHTYIRWIGNSNKFINYHSKKLTKSGIESKRDKITRELNLNFNESRLLDNIDSIPIFDIYREGDKLFLDYPDYIKSGTTIYHLKEADGINAKYTPINYIGLSIISPYHLDLVSNEELYHNRHNITGIKNISNQEEDFMPNIDDYTSIVGDTEATKPEEYITDSNDIVSENSIFDIMEQEQEIDFNSIPEPTESNISLNENNYSKLQSYVHNNYLIGKKIRFINNEGLIDEGRINSILNDNYGKYTGFEINDNIVSFDKVLEEINDKPSSSLEKAIEENITKYFENFYYTLDNEQKGKLANRGVPRLNSPSDLIKDFNKSKEEYNNNFDKYIDYIKTCRL